MKKDLPPFVVKYLDRDKELYKAVSIVSEVAFSGNALDPKTKLLIALALDTVLGSTNGVSSLARQAREAGANDQEISETLRIAYYVSGMKSLSTGNAAFEI